MNRESIFANISAGVLIRRTLFLVALIGLTLANLLVLFKGLNSPQAMDQAQIAREFARGHGFATKMVRPIAYFLAEKKEGHSISLTKFQDTYHSPLNPLVNAAVFKLLKAEKSDSFQLGTNEYVYQLDRVVAMVSTFFFLMALGMTYLLVSKIFDAKIAGVTALLMLFCQTFWDYALSGLPQMLMLFLFSCAIYFIYRSVEASTEGRVAMVPALLAGVFLTLLATAHWMAVWIALGYIVFAAFAFRPRGAIALFLFLLLLIPTIWVIARNQSINGTPFGTAFYTLFNGLGSHGAETEIMRTIKFDPNEFDPVDGIFGKIVRTTLLQASEIIPLLAGIIIAPLFFLSLLHPFRRTTIATFRWAILLMWLATAFGLSFFGVSSEALEPNQLHLLFAPIMTAYGLAFISILWSRLEIVTSAPILRDFHHIAIVLICTLPLIIPLFGKIRVGLQTRDKGGIPNWPPYYAPALNSKASGLKAWVDKNEIIFSDQPWAVAWYADRTSVWLPTTVAGFQKFETIANNLKTPSAGILISPCSHGSGSTSDVIMRYRDFSALVLDGQFIRATYPPGVTSFDKAQVLQGIYRKYPFRQYLVGTDMIFYSDHSPESTTEQ